jgi:5-methylcytosine-specific restriction endonuclease McrA
MHNSKPCPRCGQVKHLDDFRKNKSKPLGVSSFCKACANESERLGRPFLTPEQREKDKANSRRFYKKNKHKSKSCAASTKAYLDKHPGLRSHYISSYRARKRSNGVYQITKSEIKGLLSRPCFYCGCVNKKITLDHVLPISRGGRHSIGNLVPACYSCNSSKGAKFLAEWRKGK